MVNYLLQITADLENLTDLQPQGGCDDPNFSYLFKVSIILLQRFSALSVLPMLQSGSETWINWICMDNGCWRFRLLIVLLFCWYNGMLYICLGECFLGFVMLGRNCYLDYELLFLISIALSARCHLYAWIVGFFYGVIYIFNCVVEMRKMWRGEPERNLCDLKW